MSFPSGVTWELLPHTAAKHEILRQYLGAWFPILGIGTGSDLYYFDGFAGPGEYTGGELGSPLIALNTAANVASMFPSSVYFVFSELEAPRARHLSDLLSGRYYPPHFNIDVRSAVPFEEVMVEYLDRLEVLGTNPPMFVFIDPLVLQSQILFEMLPPSLYLGLELDNYLLKVCWVRQTVPPWVIEARCQAWVAAPFSEQSPNSIRGRTSSLLESCLRGCLCCQRHPRRSPSRQSVQLQQQLAHHGHQCHVAGFPALAQVLVETL